MGCDVAVDDFGTGYSSLAYLNRFPVDTLEIDRSFVSDLGDEDEHKPVVRTIIAMAKALRLVVTAEGVESASQAGLDARCWMWPQGRAVAASTPAGARVFRAVDRIQRSPQWQEHGRQFWPGRGR
jgi:sensor c-di-GMP phosphodiesterase-like protein